MSDTWLTFDDLEKSMRGQSCLEGYDVLVSYSETQLNLLLQDATAKDNNTQINVPEFITTVAAQWPNPTQTTYRINLVLEKPNFSFAGPTTSTECILSYSMSGSVSMQNGDQSWGTPTAIPGGLRLLLSSQLSTMIGSVHDTYPNSAFVPAHPPIQASGDNAVHLDQNQQLTSALVVYIPKGEGSGGHVDIVADVGSLTSNAVTGFMQSLFKTSMESYFQQRDWYYFLATVNNSTPANSNGVYALQPTSFGFSIAPGNGKTDESKIDNAICMWVTVVGGSGRAVFQPGDTCKASFSTQNETRSPIPIGKGSTASIIFSHDLMQDLFLKPAITKIGCTEVSPAGIGQGGLSTTFKWPHNHFHRDGVDDEHTDNYFGGFTYTKNHVDAIDFNIEDTATTLTIAPGLSVTGVPSGTISWSSPTLKLNWQNDHDVTTFDAGGPNISDNDDHEGVTDIDFSFTGSGHWVNPDVSNPNTLDFAWTLPSNFQVKVTPETKDLSWWQKVFSDWDNGIPSNYTNISFALPSLNLSDNTFNYFLTTNLLLPGKQVFGADPLLAASATDGKGIAVPYDTLLTGSINMDSNTTVAPRAVSRFAMKQSPLHKQEKAFPSDGVQEFAKIDESGSAINHKIGPQASHARLIHANVNGNKSLRTFVSTVVNCSPMMGSLINAASASPPAIDDFWTILQTNGYGNLTADDLLSILGSNTAEILGPVDAATNGIGRTELSTKPDALLVSRTGNKVFADNTVRVEASSPSSIADAFDIRIFGVVYTLTSSSETVTDQRLIVSPTDGQVTIDGETVLPTANTDWSVKPPLTKVAWKTTIASYTDIIFKSTPDDDGVFLASFTGNITPVGQSQMTISGLQYVKADPNIPDKDMQIIDLVGFAFGFIGVIAFGVAVLWRRADNEDKKAREILEAQNKDLEKRRTEKMEKFYQEIADKKAQEVAEATPIPWDDFKQEISDSTSRVLADKIGTLTLDQLSDPKMDSLESEEWLGLLKDGKAAIDTATTNAAISFSIGEVATSLAPFIQAGFLPQDHARAICKVSLQPQSQAMANKLSTDLNGGTSYLYEVARGQVLARRAVLRQQEVTRLTGEATRQGNNGAMTQEEMNQKIQRRAEVQAELVDPNTDPTKMESLQEEALDLRKAIDELTTKHTEAQNAEADNQKKAAELDRDRSADENNKDAKERAAQAELDSQLVE